MCLEVLKVAGFDARLGADPLDQRDLGVRVGHGQAAGAAVLVGAAADDHRMDRVAVAHRVRQALERDQTDALGAHVAVGRGVEGARPAIRGQEPAFGLGDGVLRRHMQQRAPGEREAALAAQQALARQVDGHQ